MPSITSLVLTDRQGTPVSYTLLPAGKAGEGIGVVALADSTGALVSEKRFSLGTRRSGKRVRSTIRFRVPIMVNETINGITTPVVARESFVDCTFNFDASSLESERNDVVGMFASCFTPSKTLVNDTIVKSQTVWGL